MADWAHQDAGSPAEIWTEIRSPPNDTRLYYDVLWTDKTPTRLPEVHLNPNMQPGSHVLTRQGQPTSGTLPPLRAGWLS